MGADVLWIFNRIIFGEWAGKKAEQTRDVQLLNGWQWLWLQIG